MKTYISKNQSVKQGSLVTDELVVDGQLIVTGALNAKVIRGRGSIQARDITAGEISIRSVTAEETLTADTVLADRVYAEYGNIGKRMYTRICSVVTHLKGVLVVSPLLGCRETDIEECVVLPQRQYSWLRFRWSTFWLRRHSNRQSKKQQRKQRRKNTKKQIAELENLLAAQLERVGALEKAVRALQEEQRVSPVQPEPAVDVIRLPTVAA